MATTKFKIWECDFCDYTETIEGKKVKIKSHFLSGCWEEFDTFPEPTGWGIVKTLKKSKKDKWQEKDICPDCLAKLKEK